MIIDEHEEDLSVNLVAPIWCRGRVRFSSSAGVYLLSGGCKSKGFTFLFGLVGSGLVGLVWVGLVRLGWFE